MTDAQNNTNLVAEVDLMGLGKDFLSAYLTSISADFDVAKAGWEAELATVAHNKWGQRRFSKNF